jgi:hypothetical protein
VRAGKGGASVGAPAWVSVASVALVALVMLFMLWATDMISTHDAWVVVGVVVLVMALYVKYLDW